MNKYLDFEREIEILDIKINELDINDNNFISEKNKKFIFGKKISWTEKINKKDFTPNFKVKNRNKLTRELMQPYYTQAFLKDFQKKKHKY